MSNPFATEEMAAGYAAARPPVHPRVLAQYFAQRENGRVEMSVDLGCGAGLSTSALVPYASRVLGLEPALLMLHLARGLVPGAVFAAAAGEALPLRYGSVDLITAAGSLNYVRDLDQCFDEMRRVLRPDGSVLVYDFGAGRRFKSRDELNGWFETFVTRYPYPASEARPLNPDILAALAHGFDLRRQSPFVIGLPMARPAYEAYILTETNVAAAIRDGETLAGISAWVHDPLVEFWGDDTREVLFEGYWADLWVASTTIEGRDARRTKP
jgi:SAM-dependent methyltransferase